ncbi:MAG TPA: CAP domain-containing protein [Pirellulaceae bacterium]|jgi:uncharacterized protein YkwD|nr:CAP domain-containing protein [Pirellulaceae bacterium]
MNGRLLNSIRGVALRTALAVVIAAATLLGFADSAEANFGRTARIENDTYALTHAGWTYAYWAFYNQPNDPDLAQGYLYAQAALDYADYLWNTAYYGYFDRTISWRAYRANWRIQMTYSYYAAQYEQQALKTSYSDNAYYGYVYLYYAYLASYYTSFAESPYEPKLTPAFRKLLVLHNSDRASLGFEPLTVDRDLMRIAQNHAEWMLANETVSHFGPNGETVQRRARRAGYRFTKISQNVLYGYATEEEVFAVWHSSQTGERLNIRDLKWDHVGFGVAGTGADRYWCAVYATKRN